VTAWPRRVRAPWLTCSSVNCDVVRSKEEECVAVSYSNWAIAVAFGSLVISGCGGAAVPQSVRDFAAELPARADGQYAPLDDLVKKQLVLKDALLQCDLDQIDKKPEAESAACACARSSSDVWTSDCEGWLGQHVPAPATPEAGPDAAPTPVPPS
jgi:hypothetical protein